MAEPATRFEELRGPTPRWRGAEWLALAVLAALAVALRLHQLGAEGFADDEVHKWLAANRYLHGDFGGDDVEHPMMMKALIALCIAALPHALSPETLTRIPNAVASGLEVLLVAQLGKRLFGPRAGLLGAAIYAVCATAIGYGRVAKEDTLLGLFGLALLLCFAEAKAAADDGRLEAQRRWELGGALSLAAMFAAKYFVFLFPVPLFIYFWLRPVSAWRVPAARWVKLTLLALVVFVAIDWVLVLPSTWRYFAHYIAGEKVADRASSESLLFMGRLYDNMGLHWRHGVPGWFHLVFAWVKLAPPTALLAFAGLGLALLRRRPAHRIALAWIGWSFVVFVIINARYGRYFIPLLPVFVLLAAHAAIELTNRFPAAVSGLALGGLATLLVGTEARAALGHAPHQRLYVSALGGGDERLDWYFPHCDYFDAGVREAVQQVAARAEPGAEVASETGWLVRFYADAAGRSDLVDTAILPHTACTHGRPCYVLVQGGRRYWHNQAALDALAQRQPWGTVEVGGHTAVRIYRLDPGVPAFPPASLVSAE